MYLSKYFVTCHLRKSLIKAFSPICKVFIVFYELYITGSSHFIAFRDSAQTEQIS